MAINATLNFNEAQLKRLERAMGSASTPAGNAVSSSASSTSGGGGAIGAISNVIKGLTLPLIKIVAVATILAVGFSGTIGLLKGLAKILGLILKPIDLLLMTIMMPLFWVLMPLIKMLNIFLMPFLKAYRASLMGNREAITSGEMSIGQAYLEAGVAGVTAMLVPLLDLVRELGSMFIDVFVALDEAIINAMAGMATAFSDAIFDTLWTLVDVIQQAFGPVIEWIGGAQLRETFDTAMENLKGNVLSMKTMSSETIETWRMNMIEDIRIAADTIKGIWENLLNDLIAKLQESILKAESISSSYDDWLRKQSTADWWATTGQSQQDLLNRAWRTDENVPIPLPQHGGYVSSTGLATVHQGEYISQVGAGGGISGGVTVNMTVNANVNGRYDIRDLSRQLAEDMEREISGVMKRGF